MSGGEAAPRYPPQSRLLLIPCGSVLTATANFPVTRCGTCVGGLAALQAFQRWKDGRTGLPLVDANMRELAQTGMPPCCRHRCM